MSDVKIAVVTGGNRGIGLEICRQLAQRPDLHVVLTARSMEKAQAAAAILVGLNVSAQVLDVCDSDSVAAFTSWSEQRFGGIDILINNAGVLLDYQRREASVFALRPETLQATLATNLYGPLSLCQALIPRMKKRNYGRVVNLSSGMGQLSDMGGGAAAYRLSKTALNALTRILAAELQDSPVLVNAMCPGWVKTEMGGAQAPRSVEQGADTAVWLATLPDDGPRGLFFRDRTPIDW